MGQKGIWYFKFGKRIELEQCRHKYDNITSKRGMVGVTWPFNFHKQVLMVALKMQDLKWRTKKLLLQRSESKLKHRTSSVEGRIANTISSYDSASGRDVTATHVTATRASSRFRVIGGVNSVAVIALRQLNPRRLDGEIWSLMIDWSSSGCGGVQICGARRGAGQSTPRLVERLIVFAPLVPFYDVAHCAMLIRHSSANEPWDVVIRNYA